MSWTLPTELDQYYQIKAAATQIFQLQIDEGHRYFRDAPTKESMKPDEEISAGELASQCAWIALKNGIFLMCQCVGSQNEITNALDNNFSLDSLGVRKDEAIEMLSKIQFINNTLRRYEVSKLRASESSDLAAKETMMRVMRESNIDDDMVVDIVNTMPAKQVLRWLSHSINVNIIPFKHEMYKIIGK